MISAALFEVILKIQYVFQAKKVLSCKKSC